MNRTPFSPFSGLPVFVLSRAVLAPGVAVLKRLLRALLIIGFRLALFVVLLYILNYSTLPLYDRWTAIGVIARDVQFDYISWELNALAVKTHETLYGRHPFMEETDRSQYVRDYMADLAEAERLEGQINAIFTDPSITDAAAESVNLRAERDALRDDLRRRQPLAEAILEGQIAAVLVDEGFSIGGQILPPIAAHFTQVPTLLVVSPRDEIRFDVMMNLNAMPVDAQAALEDSIDEAQDVASLIVPLGGIALYPSMILETSSIPYALDVISHEWLHNYLIVFPLGYSYDMAGEARIINETTAYQFGTEMSRRVLARYYPELVPPPQDTVAGQPIVQSDAPRFDFGAEMNETRVHVDELLAEGQVEEAERYMEERRQRFVANGYPIRKLNQAYFAFYGGYQTGSPGSSGSDPIGPAVQTIRAASPSIHEWIITMCTITTREQLLAAAAQVTERESN